MAHIEDRKRDFYSQKQSVRDESSAPVYLVSAGDVLLKKLSEKQLDTKTTLEDQLKISQNFHKSYQLNPDSKRGLCTFNEFQKQVLEESEKERPFGGRERKQNVGEVLKEAGLTRLEVELTLCEKPESVISKLYTFAVGNKKQEAKTEVVEKLLPNHPINHLAELHEEHFGHLKSRKREAEEKFDEESSFSKASAKPVEERKEKLIIGKRRKPRKRKKKSTVAETSIDSKSSSNSSLAPEATSISDIKTEVKKKISRPSLWDVKDLKKWCQPKKELGCKPRTWYALKDGKIIKLEDLNNDVT